MHFGLRPVIAAGALVFACLLGGLTAQPAAAEENVVSIDPLGLRLAPGNSFEVSVITEPPPQTVATWIIFLEFDPAFVTTESRRCDSLDTPAGAVSATGCEVVDTDADGLADTAKMFGGIIFTETEQGLTEPTVLADIGFDVQPEATGCTFLQLKIINHTDADANETGARVRDSRICSDAAAPASPTFDPTDIPVRTSEPPDEEDLEEAGNGGSGGDDGSDPDGGDDGDGSDGGDGSGDDGDEPVLTDAAGSPVTPSGSPGETGTASPDGDDDGEEQGAGGVVRDDDDGGGVSPVVWVAGALAVLGAVGGGAWWIVRSRAESAPGPDASS
jgi:hypothetical protein